MKDTVLIDLDGTLANIDHRAHLVKEKRWKEFYAACDKDTPYPWAMSLIESFITCDYKVVILTARSREVEQKTIEWLNYVAELYPPDMELVMVRAEGDYSKDFELKRKWAEAYGLDRILFAVDDQTQVIEMWRSIGVTALQCAKGDF